ncbi:MAG: T9SS type A sorting domain-containing protein, partial [Bacteroidota bacterium]
NIWDINNYTNATKEYDKINLTNRPHVPLCTFMSLFTIISTPDACLPFEPNGLSVNTCCPQDGAKINFMYAKKANLAHDILPISNGAAQSLLSLIAQGSSVSASDLYAALDYASPYLSDAVMIAMLQTSQHLNETQVVNILVENSELTQAVLSALSYRNLTQNALNTINQAQSSVSSREIQEERVAQDQRDISDARVDLVNYYLSGNLLDTINNYSDSLIAFLGNETDELSIKQLASIYVEHGQTSLASQKLNLLDANSTENSNFIALMNVLISLKNDGKNVFQMSSAQEQTIRSIAATSTITAFNAQSILGLVFGEYIIKRPIQIVQTFGKKGNSTTGTIENTIANKNVLSVYPNPASNYATVEYLMNNSVKSGKIIVSTIDGATTQTIDLKQKSGQYELDLRNLSAGVYFIELRGDDAILSVKKLIVTKN